MRQISADTNCESPPDEMQIDASPENSGLQLSAWRSCSNTGEFGCHNPWQVLLGETEARQGWAAIWDNLTFIVRLKVELCVAYPSAEEPGIELGCPGS